MAGSSMPDAGEALKEVNDEISNRVPPQIAVGAVSLNTIYGDLTVRSSFCLQASTDIN